MSNIMEQSLSRTTAATFEELALLFPEVDPTPAQQAATLGVTVSVDFRGPLTGRLVLRASESILPTIAANMLGEDESQKAPLQRDALGELANVICGNLLPNIAGAEVVFHLDAPRVHIEGTPRSREDDAPLARAHFGVEHGRVEAQLFVFTGLDALTPASRGVASAA